MSADFFPSPSFSCDDTLQAGIGDIVGFHVISISFQPSLFDSGYCKRMRIPGLEWSAIGRSA